MSRRLKLWLAVTGVIVVLGGGFLWALPEIVRRTIEAQVPKLTGRAISIEDIDLNLFTGRLVLRKLRLAERDPAEAFVQADHVDLRVSPLSVVSGHLRLANLTLAGPTIRIVRTGPVEFNFSDLLARLPPADPAKPKSRWTVSIGRLALVDGALLISDRAVSPAEDWQIRGITIQAGGLTTRAAQQPGHLEFRARVNEAPFDATAKSVVLTPAALSVHVTLDRFDLTQVRPYLPPGLPASLLSGSLGLALEVGVERGEEGLKRAGMSGDIRVEGLALAQPGRTAPFLKLPRLTVALKEADLLTRSATLKSVEVEGLDLRAARDRAGSIDLLALAGGSAAAAAPAKPAPAPAPSSRPESVAPRPAAAAPFKVKLEQLTLKGGAVVVTDDAVSPAREWRVQGVVVEGSGLSTSPDDPPGTLKIGGQVASTPGARKPASISVDAGSLRLMPLAATARMVLEGFDLGALGPYWPADLPAIVQAGSLGVTVDLGVEKGESGLSRGVASGSVRLDRLALTGRDQPAPFLTVPKLTVGLKQADLIARTVALGSIAVEGMDARAVRDATGTIDLLELIAAAPVPPAAPPAVASPTARRATPPASGPRPWRLSLDRFGFTKGTARFEDRAVSPSTTLALTDLTVTAERVMWPSTSPATFTVSVSMPGGGRTDVKGTAQLEPLDVRIAMSTRDAPIEPYQPYFPFPARFFGFFSGDSVNEIQRAKGGPLILASRGHAWARDFEVRAPGVDTPAVRLAGMDIRGLDFSWPNYALIERVTLTRLEAQIERGAGGNINLRRLFEARDAQAPPAAGSRPPEGSPARAPAEVKPPAGQPPARSGGLMQELVLDFNEITIEDGYIRFLDRTTTPAFSEDMSGFALTIRGASNQMGRQHTSMTAQAKVGGDATLQMQGELSGAGESLRAELAGDLRDFALAAANPYTDSLISWIIERGKLTTHFQFRVEGDRLIVDQDLKVAGLQVERSRPTDEARRRLGLPLGLVVAMLKDRHGDIDLSIPLRGTLSDGKFDWSEAIWASARQVVVKLVVSPFSAIGRAVTSGDDKVDKLEVDPVTFAAGSVVLTEAMDAHLTRVADFLRRAPYIQLKLTPAASAADLESLKGREVSARLARLQRERGLADLAATVRLYYQERVSDVTLPRTVDDQLALLRAREPVPAGPLGDLLKGRTDVTRERLAKAEGIPAQRLTVAAPSAAGATGEGRVEFDIVAADE